MYSCSNGRDCIISNDLKAVRTVYLQMNVKAYERNKLQNTRGMKCFGEKNYHHRNSRSGRNSLCSA